MFWDTLVNYTTGNIQTGGFDHKLIEKENENKKLPFILKDELKSPEYTLQPLESYMFHKLNELPWQRFAVFPARPLFAHTDVFQFLIRLSLGLNDGTVNMVLATLRIYKVILKPNRNIFFKRRQLMIYI